MRFESIRPFIRFASRISIRTPHSNHLVTAQDCRLFYPCSGRARLLLPDRVALASQLGHAVYLPAGTPYIWQTLTPAPEFYVLNFDFTAEHTEYTQPLPLLEGAATQDCFSVPSLEDAPFFSLPLFFPQIPSLETLLQDMAWEADHPRLFSQMRLSSLMQSVLVCLARQQLGEAPHHPQIIDTMIRFIRHHYAQPIQNRDIANAVRYHPNYANQLFLRHTGRTLRQYLISYRIQRALELLLSTELTLTEIAAATGFASPSRFSKEFSNVTGHPPSQYRKTQAH